MHIGARPYPDPVPEPTPTARLWPLYLGGFLGPFGGAIVNTMLPQLAQGLNTSTATASAAITAYVLPFAALMVASGTLATRWGLARTVRFAYLVYVLASIVCVVAASTAPFLAGRALQGVANAFTTPLLITMIYELAPRRRVGRSLGTYASMQAAGQAFAPFVGGVAAGIDYRWAFAATALAAGALIVLTPSPGRAEGPHRTAPWRPLLNARLGRAGALAFCAQFAATLIIVVSALLAAHRFGLSPGAGGLVVASFGATGLLAGSRLGRLADAIGMRRTGVGALVTLAAAVALAGGTPWVAGLVACLALAGAGATGARVLTSSLAVASTPANRSGATALMLSAQFLGSAAVPLALPLYEVGPVAVCLLGAGVAALGVALALAPEPRGR